MTYFWITSSICQTLRATGFTPIMPMRGTSTRGSPATSSHECLEAPRFGVIKISPRTSNGWLMASCPSGSDASREHRANRIKLADSGANVMRIIIALTGLVIFICPTQTLAQRVCNSPQSCAKLHCKRTCVDTWQNGVCLGGYCPQGAPPAPVAAGQKKDMMIHKASPELQQKIREL